MPRSPALSSTPGRDPLSPNPVETRLAVKAMANTSRALRKVQRRTTIHCDG